MIDRERCVPSTNIAYHCYLLLLVYIHTNVVLENPAAGSRTDAHAMQHVFVGRAEVNQRGSDYQSHQPSTSSEIPWRHVVDRMKIGRYTRYIRELEAGGSLEDCVPVLNKEIGRVNKEF